MDQIAKGAGASTRTLYSRFKNKAELLEAVARRNVQRIVADHLRSFALTPERTDPRAYLYEFGVHIGASSLMDETAGLIRVTFAEAHRFPVLAQLYNELTQRSVTEIAEALRGWREQGRVDFDTDAEHLATICFHMMSSELRIRASLGDPVQTAELNCYVGRGVDLFLRGIASEGRRAGRASAGAAVVAENQGSTASRPTTHASRSNVCPRSRGDSSSPL